MLMAASRVRRVDKGYASFHATFFPETIELVPCASFTLCKNKQFPVEATFTKQKRKSWMITASMRLWV
jgi:hypothetical protein